VLEEKFCRKERGRDNSEKKESLDQLVVNKEN
jgi:hypothetical protein